MRQARQRRLQRCPVHGHRGIGFLVEACRIGSPEDNVHGSTRSYWQRCEGTIGNGFLCGDHHDRRLQDRRAGPALCE